MNTQLSIWGTWWECNCCGLMSIVKPERNKKCPCGAARMQAMRRCKCGTVFHVGRLSVGFCSVSCGSRYNIGRRKGKTFESERRAPVKVCLTCSNEFRAVMEKKARPMRFCSFDCYMKSTKETTIEEAVRKWLEMQSMNYIAQHKIGRYYVDFYLPDSGTVIEADGDYWHSKPKVIAKDARKENWLLSKGYEVIRLPECEIKSGVDFAIRKRWGRYALEAGLDPGPGALP